MSMWKSPLSERLPSKIAPEEMKVRGARDGSTAGGADGAAWLLSVTPEASRLQPS
jgi:hypothetical protein